MFVQDGGINAGHKRLNFTIGRTHEVHILPTAKGTALFNDGARLQ